MMSVTNSSAGTCTDMHGNFAVFSYVGSATCRNGLDCRWHWLCECGKQ